MRIQVMMAIGAATACPDIARPRITALTDRFTDAVKKFGGSRDETGRYKAICLE